MTKDEFRSDPQEVSTESGSSGVGKSRYIVFVELLASLLVLYNIIAASRVITLLGIYVPSAVHRAINLTVIVILVFTFYSIKGNKRERGVAWYDLLLMLMGVVGAGYAILFQDAILEYSMYGFLDTKGIILFLLIGIPLFEMIRRVSGWVLPSLIGLIILATLFQGYLPGILYGNGFGLDRLGFAAYVGPSGIFGLPLGIATTILIVFIVFARLLQVCGAGQWFIDIALAMTGRLRGGPAKAAVLASALFGSISGSPSSNVATTGSITIPLMKSVGYRASFAGGVEAVASTGGQVLPPVMGAIAFVMAEWIGVPYAQIAMAALIPALLYYMVLFMSIQFESQRLNLKPVPVDQVPPLWKTFTKGWFYLPPLIVLVYLMFVKKFSPDMAAIFSILTLILCSFASKDKSHHLVPIKIWRSFVPSVKTWLLIGVITAGVGLMISALELSGLSVRLAQFIIDLSGGELLVTLILIGLCCFVLGMGMDSIPAYITLATVAAPALTTLGVEPMVAHLYVIYWGMASFITPPLCLAVFVACGISGGKIWETGWEAVRLGIAIFVIPFAFVYNEALLLQGSLLNIILSTVTAFVGVTLIAGALRRFLFRNLAFYQSILLFIAGLILIAPGWLTALIGLTIAAVALIPTSQTKNHAYEEIG
ncbi:TRAP transporter permease [Bacillus sp. Marseille-P3661]|uniref:TRAP transporter permease n=1 Tax=Bacillus sp. Marseille-P3661 TaxID=1936234 RepID=UPI000C814DA4|nr:TRAP transporter fused permease subunit [Bacillus sp. Marseille-P3661]